MISWPKVEFEISELAVKAWKKVSDAGLSVEPEKKSGKKSEPTAVYLCDGDLANTQNGKKNMRLFVENMVKDFETHFWQILDDEGNIKLGKKKFSWNELSMKVPTYPEAPGRQVFFLASQNWLPALFPYF